VTTESTAAYIDEDNTPFTEEEAMFQHTVRTFFQRELDGKLAEHEARGSEGPEFWKRAAEVGLLGLALPEEYGGAGAGPVFNVIVSYELGRTLGFATVGGNIATDLSTNILVEGGSPEQLAQYAPRILGGAIQGMALTEPGAGSDVAAIRTRAVRDGDDYVINGNKVYISNGYLADLLYVVTKTNPDAGYKGLTMFVIEGDTPGLSRSRMKTMSFPAGGVGDLHFTDVRVPARNIVGGEGGAVKLLSNNLAVDRLQTGARALAQAELALVLTTEFVKQRRIQGSSLFDFQHTKMKLAEIRIDIAAGRALMREGVVKLRAGQQSVTDAAMAKVWLAEMSARALDTCVQLHGGAGFMDAMPISRLYTSNRQFRIVAGTSELLKLSVAKRL
jgi:acyl-CoA dehydrogenase